MAEGDVVIHNNAKAQSWSGGLDFRPAGNTIKVALLSGYTRNIDAHGNFSDVSANQVSGAGYTAGGITLANKTLTQDNANDRAVFDADNVTWTALNVGTPSHAVMYRDTGAAATSTIFATWELGRASNGGDYTLAWDAVGIATLT